METNLYIPFVESVKQIMHQMTGIEIDVSEEIYAEDDEITSLGVSSIISYTGKMKGRLLLDMERDLAITIANKITGENHNNANEYMVLAAISELNNIIAGDGITQLNNQQSLSLRLSPPIVFCGRNTVISIPKISSVSIKCTTQFGSMKINAAFERSI